MKHFKCVLLFIFAILLLPNLALSNEQKPSARYFLIYDWIANEPLFEIPAKDITLYPFLIRQTKGKDFISYRTVSLWDSIGTCSSGINISSIAGFKASYEKNRKKSLELSEYGNYILNKSITIQRKSGSYIAETNNGDFKASSTVNDNKRTISYTNSVDNQIIIEIESSTEQSHIKSHTVKMFVNNQLTVYCKISERHIYDIEISSIFAGQKITTYEKDGKLSTLSSLGTVYKATITNNITEITTSGRMLTIKKNSEDNIVSSQLVSAGKTRYTEDIEYFDDYILITKFDVVEKTLTEIELGYDDIVLYEVRKNIEDIIYYEYEYNKKSKEASLNQYLSGKLIATSLYTIKDGIKELKEIQYTDEDNCETIKKYKNNEEKTLIRRNSKNIFIATSNLNTYDCELYNNVKSSSVVKQLNVSKSNKKTIYKNKFSGIMIEKEPKAG
ncbi:MAG: hypothetical protein KAS07_06175, partial [Candidatus Pacebacteria bacterium]|nr:hypothetical protein [Candidatus Paceibacterota bacterium]